MNIAMQIACCIERVRIESGYNPAYYMGEWIGPENEVYWYTREAAPNFGRKFDISFSQIMMAP